MAQYHYTPANGWLHTDTLSKYFARFDFLKDSKVTSDGKKVLRVVASEPRSLKSTTVTDVERWLEQSGVKKNIKKIEDAIADTKKYKDNHTGAEVVFTGTPTIHILMPKENAMTLKSTWESFLTTKYKDRILFQVSAIEDILPRVARLRIQ